MSAWVAHTATSGSGSSTTANKARSHPGRAGPAGRRHRGRQSRHRGGEEREQRRQGPAVAQAGECAGRDDVPRRRAARQCIGRLWRGHALEGVDPARCIAGSSRRGSIASTAAGRGASQGRRSRPPSDSRRRSPGVRPGGRMVILPKADSACPQPSDTELDGGVPVHRDGLVGGPETQERAGRMHPGVRRLELSTSAINAAMSRGSSRNW